VYKKLNIYPKRLGGKIEKFFCLIFLVDFLDVFSRGVVLMIYLALPIK